MAGTNIEASEYSGEKSGWVLAHEALSLLARGRAAADAEEGRWFLAALRSAAHVHLGYGSFGEYIERLFGYKPSLMRGATFFASKWRPKRWHSSGRP
ncbi:MAG TPA: hypothetical protein VH062_28510 [Polyangiaceae bacterium]|jgi:hypothetical protein|nr:hypothetical protein [Polyangiaceae bacterium]